jgi:hypothetical protein
VTDHPRGGDHDSLRREAGGAWSFRTRVELDAERRFGRLAEVIASFDPGSPVPGLLRKARDDERRHALLCASLARDFGVEPETPPEGPSIAPASLDARRAALYEMVAACCITETESVATVATLLAADCEPKVAAALHEIARDEVSHSRMGWAHLAREAGALDVGFLSPWIPVMLAGTVPADFFARTTAEPGDLLRFGVLPHAKKKEIFAATLRVIVFPGLEQHGVDAAPARAWLDARTSTQG